MNQSLANVLNINLNAESDEESIESGDEKSRYSYML